MRTILIRAEQVGLISKRQMGQQLGIISKNHGADQEPGKLPESINLNRLERFVFLALLQEKINLKKASAILDEPLKSIQHKFTEWTKQG